MDTEDVKKWLTFNELQERNRCIKCKRPLDEFVMCERCLEFKYCSIHCLEDDRDNHFKYCNLIGLRKGLLQNITDEESQFFEKVKEKAKLLNEDGSVRMSRTFVSEGKKKGEESIEEENEDKIQAGVGKAKLRKKKKSKTARRKHKDNNSFGNKEQDQKEAAIKKTSVKLLIAGGQFGGAAKADQKVQSGESFGEGWWNPTKSKSKVDQTNTDPNSASSGGKLNNNNADQDETFLPGTASPTEVTLEKALSGLEIVRYDPKQAEERSGRARSSFTLGKCFFCGMEGPVLKCSRCKIASYCDKNCQKSDYKKHSSACKLKEKFDKALSKIPKVIKVATILALGSFNVSPFLAALPEEFEFMVLGPRCHVMVEIVDKHPHPFRFGAIVKDLRGETSQVLFYTETPFYHHRMMDMFGLTVPIPLSLCIKPGNFILILEAHWHYFLDGTRGIRVDDIGDVFFIFKDELV